MSLHVGDRVLTAINPPRRLDKIAFVHLGKIMAANVHSLWPDHIELRLMAGGYQAAMYEDEGRTWARGWEGPAYNALLTVVALGGAMDTEDEDWDAYT